MIAHAIHHRCRHPSCMIIHLMARLTLCTTHFARLLIFSSGMLPDRWIAKNIMDTDIEHESEAEAHDGDGLLMMEPEKITESISGAERFPRSPPCSRKTQQTGPSGKCNAELRSRIRHSGSEEATHSTSAPCMSRFSDRSHLVSNKTSILVKFPIVHNM